jgi:hypothetical protein
MQASRAAGRGPGHPGRKHSRGPGRR